MLKNQNNQEQKNLIEVNSIAPNIRAKLQDGSDFDLYKVLESGKNVLLVFYPGDDTPGCTKQLCGIRDVYSEYSKYNISVYGVNHASLESHSNFINKYKFPFDIIVDENKEISIKYGAQKKFFKNLIIKRGVFLINKDKKVVYRFWGQQDNNKVLEIAKSL